MLAKGGNLTPHQVVVSLVTMTLFIPCVAQFFMMIKERGIRKTLWITAVVLPIAFWCRRWAKFSIELARDLERRGDPFKAMARGHRLFQTTRVKER